MPFILLKKKEVKNRMFKLVNCWFAQAREVSPASGTAAEVTLIKTKLFSRFRGRGS